ncbi:leucine-rich repeat and calponin homology domain-containing protein 1 [Falco biarmicus]|uniref:leucine-rich repeat and calponin homology domain-containing protein 1 n=1 Tax=Falco peregrinus TaxID=8954 RepID=UPI00188684EF|nr:leucine-rich repeat and calponin homology domain-containing protein 1 isoform X2 [Falco rusticolus]XP_055558951.1 leucine-rich repeat and calponin homology domain-containing protein 1 isoform X1 [Falco cherrug]XP_055658861.1 leucine-rich repeat and calponin homology domain-containing protein 1 [Falco peregrinus]XP_056185341.1 leucine-rich repeat and calponin homology domain-containing protein 1 [Falco biarmicus]
MATLGGESQPFPAAALTAATAGVGGGGGSLGLQAPLNRGLERALEEAAHSGGLNLSGRKLKEFPRSAAALSHDLSDTVRADLSKNRLTEVPTELCHFVSLETLNLYHNCIKIIPDAIVNLQMLTYLNLSRNQLSSLPACLCGLPLKVLIASNNKLGSLPEEIGQLKQLMELDVSCNEITALPQQIGQLKSLKELNVRRNYLEVLPQELVQLPLVKFDFSCNKVLVIPICFRKMVQLQVLLLENNPLQSPPAQICTKGKVHIFKYLTVQACQIKTADSLYLNAIEQQHLPQPVEESIDDIYPSKKDSDSGVGSDNGDKRLSATEPSDEDTISFNVPMSDIMEEDHVVKEDSGHRANSRKVEFHQGSSHLMVNDKSRETGNQFDESDTLTTEFMSYIKSRAAECDELLRIEEDTQWQTDEIINLSEEQTIDIAMIEQLREAVDLLQDPNRLSMDISESSGVNLYPTEPATALEFQESTVNSQMQMEMSSLGQRENAEEELEFQRRKELIMEKAKPEGRTCEKGEKWSLNQNDLIVWNASGQTSHNESKDKSPTMSPTTNTTIPFGLKPRSVFLRPQRNLESIDPQFTIRRKMEQMREERELVEQLRENIETRLKICLPEDLGSALMDGVVLCHLVNHVRPRSVGSIHVPSPAVPKLSMAKCRRNVENFLDACRKLGIPEEKLCLPHHILEEKGLVKVSITVQALLDVTTLKQPLFT